MRNDASTSDVFFQTSDTTWQAYNNYGGSDFYQGAANGRAYKISYNRPFATRGRRRRQRDFYFGAEYPMVRFLERNGYDVSYTTGVDTDRRGGADRNHKVFLSVGHDEYWSGAQRANVEAARDAGVNLAFFSGNEVYWRTRYESRRPGRRTPYRTLVSLQGDLGQREDRPADRVDRHLARPAVRADRGRRRQARRTRSRARSTRSNYTDLPVTVLVGRGQVPTVAQHVR